ncbi:hypothetical protein OHB06_26230 [Streptomyces sp. NBC_01604]|uniref:hypothetical protein n=1 Tax=Streptomyces sp. NBC_01604 TaxID=2975894 RepID=UPI0038702364
MSWAVALSRYVDLGGDLVDGEVAPAFRRAPSLRMLTFKMPSGSQAGADTGPDFANEREPVA